MTGIHQPLMQRKTGFITAMRRAPIAAARKAKDFATADAVRKELAEKGVLIEDTASGTQWKRA